MIILYREINKIKRELDNNIQDAYISDYRIYLKSNDQILVYVKTENSLAPLKDKFINLNIEFERFSEMNPDDSHIMDYYFSNSEKVNLYDSSRKLNNLILPNIGDNKLDLRVPVATFYSYKGGVGRSTALASCAAYLSFHYKKKVVIIDCDFEAPGFTNFFLSNPGVPLYCNGVVEYLLDEEFNPDAIEVRNYMWQVSKDYSGEGEIYIMPSGNLNDTESFDDNQNDRTHYLNGLSRLDFSDNSSIYNRFENLFNKIKSEISPDLILLDSRTGFNDIFGLTAFQLSNVVVGFFGNNVQTVPGIHFFIDSLIKRKSLVGIIVNSIIPASNKRKLFKSFKEDIESYVNSIYNTQNINDDSINSDTISIDMFPITRNEILEILGTPHEDKLDFIDLVEKKSFSDYVELFDKLNSLVTDINPPSKDEEYVKEDDAHLEVDEFQQEQLVSPSQLSKTDFELNSGINEEDTILKIKNRILATLQSKLPELYAEDVEDFEIEFQENRYFFRTCMSDLFNLDKFIVLGNKGTGKTYIYRSLSNQNIVNELKSRANKRDNEYNFVHLIQRDKYFIDSTKFDSLGAFSSEKFFERFWQVYIWNVLVSELSIDLSFNSRIEVFKISDNVSTKLRFEEYIFSDEKMIIVEDEIEAIDNLLREKGDDYTIIVFDELDHIVKPHLWSERISPLINYCKKMNFYRIYPKLFLRSDLFDKLSNVNNIQALNNRVINIEWLREELFAYFFKLVLSHSKDDFFELMRKYNEFPKQHILKIKRVIDQNFKQPPTDEYILRHLTTTFFGKYADVKNTPRYGESYDWFYRNLKNANDSISLRPFIDLLTESIRWAINEMDKPYPILSPYHYTHGQARAKAVERHFNDLAKEKGNNDLLIIFSYIKDEANHKYKVLEIPQRELYTLLDEIIARFKDNLENTNKEQLVELLKVNGIISETFIRTGYNNYVPKKYTFALLYKYYLGLKNRSR